VRAHRYPHRKAGLCRTLESDAGVERHDQIVTGGLQVKLGSWGLIMGSESLIAHLPSMGSPSMGSESLIAKLWSDDGL
jgi:hypothetical protein